MKFPFGARPIVRGELLVVLGNLHCQPQLLSYTQSTLLQNLGFDQSESVQKNFETLKKCRERSDSKKQEEGL